MTASATPTLLRRLQHPVVALIVSVVAILAITAWGFVVKHQSNGLGFIQTLNDNHNQVLDTLALGLSPVFSPGPALDMSRAATLMQSPSAPTCVRL